jgi:hypothetical protein
LLQIAIAFFEVATCSFHSKMCDELRRGRADFPRKNTREIPWTHCHSIRELLDSQVITKMLGDPGLEIAENPPFCGLPCEGNTELSLVPRSTQENDQASGDAQRNR